MNLGIQSVNSVPGLNYRLTSLYQTGHNLWGFTVDILKKIEPDFRINKLCGLNDTKVRFDYKIISRSGSC